MKIYILFLSLMWASCTNQRQNLNEKVYLHCQLSNENSNATNPYLTIDHHNNPVISWVEGTAKAAILVYAVSADNGRSFQKPIYVMPSKGLTPHKESMPKLAFKQNGTIVAVYHKRTPTATNRFAGAIYYTLSTNKGMNWTMPTYLHTDSTAHVGRSFFDIATLPDGEVGAIWLDGRNKSKKASALYFAKTNLNNSFVKEHELDNSSCQCCRTNIYVANNNIHIAYRNIVANNIRDIAYLISKDQGASFSSPQQISPDLWTIAGCPHTGPTMAANAKGINFYWFTMGGGQGVFHTATNDLGATFQHRKLMSKSARHPQATVLSNGNIAVAWDSRFSNKPQRNSKIQMMIHHTTGSIDSLIVTTDTVYAMHPVIQGVQNNCVIIAWMQKKDKNQSIHYTRIQIDH